VRILEWFWRFQRAPDIQFGGFVGVFGGSASAAAGPRGFQMGLEILVQGFRRGRGVLKVSGMPHGLVCKTSISLNQSSGSQSLPAVSESSQVVSKYKAEDCQNPVSRMLLET